jgi:hypothetical protein
MPRIYAPNEAYENNWANTPASKGVIILPKGSDTSWFEANGFIVDSSKHALTIWDQLTVEQLREIIIRLDADWEDTLTKQGAVRAVESRISEVMFPQLDVTSEAGTEEGDTKITVGDMRDQEDGQLFYVISDEAATPVFFDEVPDGWLPLTNGGDITVDAGTVITVVEINATGYIIGLGSDDITVNSGT